uniref:DUF148 domain-containing protein n=1 Tax=Panagrolaimus sp. ES5 TaxID=591445 RepID=A0AC34FJX3_9BILA
MCLNKFTIFSSIALCFFASTVFGYFDSHQQSYHSGRYHFDKRHGGFHGGHGRGHHGLFGGLNSNLTEEQRQELKDIKDIIRKNDNNVTKQQAHDILQSFFEGIGGDALAHFNEIQTKFEAIKAKFSNFTANSNLSEAAKNFLSQVEAIRENMQITKAEEHKQIKALFDGASDEIKQELKSHRRHGHGHHGFGGRQRGGFGEKDDDQAFDGKHGIRFGRWH